MKKKALLILALVVLLSLSIVAAATGIMGKKPFKDLDAAKIESASVHLLPPDKTVQIEEIKELIEYLEDVVVHGKDNSFSEYSGQACIFTITKTDGTVMEVTAYNTFIVIDGVGYKCKSEPCEALNIYANRLLND